MPDISDVGDMIVNSAPMTRQSVRAEEARYLRDAGFESQNQLRETLVNTFDQEVLKLKP